MSSDDNESDNPIDALIKIARLKPRVPFKKDKSDLDDVKQFIIEKEIKPHSTASVPASVIYSKYYEWSSINNKKPKSTVYFFMRFKLHFNQKYVSGKIHYLINPLGFDISIENITLADREYLEKHKNGKKKSKT